MAMDGARLGTNIKNAFKALNANGSGMTPAEESQMEAFASALAGEIIKEIKDHGDIVLTDGDIPVQVSTGTGIGATKAASLSVKIK